MDDKTLAYTALSRKVDTYSTLFKYADGEQPLIYSSSRLKEAFNRLDAKFNQNWMAVVIDTALDRLSFSGWSTKSPEENGLLADLYATHKLQLESYDVHRAALITHEAYVIAWKDETGQIEVYYNDPRLVHVFYNPESPKKKTFAAKWYQGQDGRYYLTLYYPDRLEYFVTRQVIRSGIPSSAQAFIPADIPFAPNPYGVIPVFHFQISRRANGGELFGIITLQDAVNKLFADMMIAAEFGAFKQRWIITTADTSALKNAPNEIWAIPPGEGTQTQVGEFAETDLNIFLNAIDKLANSIAIISRTPKHYFMQTGSNISGEALLAMESPLVAKVERFQRSLSTTWEELGIFLYMLETGITLSPKEIDVTWQPAQAVQPKTEAETIKTNVEAGLPLKTALRWAGKAEDEIEQIELEKAEEEQAKATMGQLMLDQVKREMDQSNEQPDGSMA